MCILNENGILFQDKIGVLTPDLERLVVVLHEHGATDVCMESTSIYWMPVWRILEPYFSLKLVNPYFIKQLPGKKSDVKDAEWIATCLLKDLIRGSYVPEDRIQQLRQYDRRIFDLNKDIVYKLTKLDAALQRCNIRISNYVSATDGKSYQKVVEKIAEGTTDPKILAGLIHGRIMNRVGKDVITASLTGVITQTDIDVIRQIREKTTASAVVFLCQCVFVPFSFGMDKACGQKHPPALGVEGIDVSLDGLQALFLGQFQHFRNAPASDVAVLIGLADDDAHFAVVLQADVTHQMALIGNVVQMAVFVEIIVHGLQIFQRVDAVLVIHLFAKLRVLIPSQRHFFVGVVGDQGKLGVDDAIFHEKRPFVTDSAAQGKSK